MNSSPQPPAATGEYEEHSMRIAFGADHAGFDLKERLVEHVRSRGHEAIDVGTHGPASVDYPTFGRRAARKVLDGEADRAVLVCGTGIGIGSALLRHATGAWGVRELTVNE